MLQLVCFVFSFYSASLYVYMRRTTSSCNSSRRPRTGTRTGSRTGASNEPSGVYSSLYPSRLVPGRPRMRRRRPLPLPAMTSSLIWRQIVGLGRVNIALPRSREGSAEEASPSMIMEMEENSEWIICGGQSMN